MANVSLIHNLILFECISYPRFFIVYRNIFCDLFSYRIDILLTLIIDSKFWFALVIPPLPVPCLKRNSLWTFFNHFQCLPIAIDAIFFFFFGFLMFLFIFKLLHILSFPNFPFFKLLLRDAPSFSFAPLSQLPYLIALVETETSANEKSRWNNQVSRFCFYRIIESSPNNLIDFSWSLIWFVFMGWMPHKKEMLTTEFHLPPFCSLFEQLQRHEDKSLFFENKQKVMIMEATTDISSLVKFYSYQIPEIH